MMAVHTGVSRGFRLVTLGCLALSLGLGSCSNPSNDRGEVVASTAQKLTQSRLTALPLATYSYTVPEFLLLGRLVPVVIATNTLHVGSRVRVEATDGTLGPLAHFGASTFYVEPDTTLGSIWSTGPVELRDRADVNAGVRAPSLVLGHDCDVLGPKPPPANTPTPGIPLERNVTFAAAPAASNLALNWGDSFTLTEGRYGDVTVNSGGKLTLPRGTYWLESLTLNADAELSLEAKDGTVTLFVRNRLDWRGRVNDTATLPDFLLVYLGTGEVVLDTPFAGGLVAPNGKVTVRKAHISPYRHQMGLFAKDVWLDAEAHVRHQPLYPLVGTGGNDRTGGDGSSNPTDCAWTLPPPPSGITEVECAPGATVGLPSEVLYQYQILRYCSAVNEPAALNILRARANVDYTAAARAVLQATGTTAEYLGVSRDRASKLRAAEQDLAHAEALGCCSDADRDWVCDEQDQCPNTPLRYPTDERGCSVALPEAPNDDTVRGLVGEIKVVFSPWCAHTRVPNPKALGYDHFFRETGKDITLFLTTILGQSQTCPVWYEIEGQRLANGEDADKGGPPWGRVMQSCRFLVRGTETTPVSGPSPTMVRYALDRSHSACEGLLQDTPPMHEWNRFRVRGLTGAAVRGPWSDWTTKRLSADGQEQ